MGKLFSDITVVPAGSIWAQNPIPDYGSDQGAPSFPPRCTEPPNCQHGGGAAGGQNNPCRCSGEWGPYDLEIVDHVVVPKDLEAGEYVVSWRWDVSTVPATPRSPEGSDRLAC